ncbi:irregular chiasm C-roughest protein-like [Mytilus galloprovincialis]|uniref:irregular chiasm C-roughest protein-like n=1 Tax=Mytilus galloprovincialis TaxID=29158 RepID=UPI003F7C89AA
MAWSYFFIIVLNFTVYSRFLAEVYATGTGTELDPYQQYAKQENEVVLQCKYESGKLVWDKYVNSQRMVIASGEATINTTKYRVSFNPDSGLYYRLHILPAQSDDEAIYRCNAGINKVYFIQLTLLELPRSLGIRNASTDNRLIGTEGQDLFIECVAVGGVPAPTLSLVVLGTTVQTGVQELRYILRNIPRIYDTTNVSCLANSDALDIPITATALIYLNLMPLMPVFSVPLVTTMEMVPFSISCTSTGSRPAAAFWWIVGQNDVTIKASSQENKNADETFNVTSTLTYTVNRQFNLQPIICTANNTIGGFSNQISLFVRFAPDVSVSNVTYEMTDPTRTINCTAEGYPDIYTFYKWQHRSLYGHIIRELDGDTVLTLPVVPTTLRYQDNGEYVCTVSNGIQGTDGIKKRQGAAKITVYAQPVFTADNHERNIQYGNIGKTVDIVVHVFSVPKFIYNAWFNNGKQIQTSTKFLFSESSAEVEDVFHGKTVKVDGYKSILTINDLQNEDFTNYTLILENGIGKPVEHTVVLERSTPIEPETLSSGGIIGAVCGGLISILVVMVVMVFIIIKKRKGHQQSETTVKFEKTDSDDHTHNYEEVQNSSGTQNESNINRDQSPIKHYEALGLQDVPNAYDNLNNKVPQANRHLRPSRNYEKLGLKDAPINFYEDLTDKELQKIGGQSYGTHYEDLGQKNEAYVYDDLNIAACEEITAKSPTQYYEKLGVKNNPTVYDDLINEDAENKVYENDSKQWKQDN